MRQTIWEARSTPGLVPGLPAAKTMNRRASSNSEGLKGSPLDWSDDAFVLLSEPVSSSEPVQVDGSKRKSRELSKCPVFVPAKNAPPAHGTRKRTLRFCRHSCDADDNERVSRAGQSTGWQAGRDTSNRRAAVKASKRAAALASGVVAENVLFLRAIFLNISMMSESAPPATPARNLMTLTMKHH